MTSKLKTNFRIRRSYSKIEEVAEIPNLVAIQKKSYERFLQSEVDPDQRQDLVCRKFSSRFFP